MLRHVPSVSDPQVLIDAATRDDAAVFKLSEDRAIVATLDFFAPIVDDPYTFGRIAATNAFSDLYAMGATPLFALNIVAWPRDPAMLELLGEVIKGGVDTAKEAGAFVLGGHSVDDPEPKYGMVTIGEAHPSKLISNSGAQPGDRLVLTKPLGTGILSTALKRDVITEQEMRDAIRAMTTLNVGAARAMDELGNAVHAATDVTGFGLLGHVGNLMTASRQGARILASRAPAFDRVRELVQEGAVPGGTKRNVSAVSEFTTWSSGIDDVDKILLSDAQTSGGMLISVDSSRVDDLIRELEENKTPVAVEIGEVVSEASGLVEVLEG